MPKYRNKRIDITAVQFLLDGSKEPVDAVFSWLDRHDPQQYVCQNVHGLWIVHNHDGMTGRTAPKNSIPMIGDWLIKHEGAERVEVCGQSVFFATYELLPTDEDD